MKCKNCNTENILKANFCKNCGRQFTQQEKEQAKKMSSVEILKKAEDVKEKVGKVESFLTLSFITDNIYVRLALIIVPFIIAMVMGKGTGGNGIRIAESEDYSVYYNTVTDEYFLDVDRDQIDLKLYVPNSTDEIHITFISSEGYKDTTYTYGVDDAISINARSNGHYSVEAFSGQESENLTLYTVDGGDFNE